MARARARAVLVRLALAAALLGVLAYASIAAVVWRHARERLARPPADAADAALVLGNRAWRDGAPSPCLTGRVDAGLALARAGQVPRLVFSGGRDREDGRIEAEVMRVHARSAGYAGELLLETAAQSTRENLARAWPMLDEAGVRRVIVVSEPYHLWRVERLARASGFDGHFQVAYAAAATSCWRRWGMAFRGALREPLAIVNNAMHGDLR